ncbi:hypothetical protein Tco_1312612 [Tanacetum coccineum]
MATINESFPQGTDSGSGPRCQDTILGDVEAQIRFEAASKQSNDQHLSRVNILGSGEDSKKLKELMEFCTKLSERALDIKTDRVNWHKLTTVSLVNTVRLNLMLSVQVNAVEGDLINTSIKAITMSTPKFAKTHNLVAFLDKPEESEGFEQIIDFLNASSIRYALTVNPTIYTTCIEQFWATAKVKTVNEERQIQALVDKKRVIITETSIRSDLKLEDAEGTYCLPTATIFAELERMGYENLTQKLTFYKAYFSSQWKFLIHTILQCLSAKTTAWNEFSSTMASAIICLAKQEFAPLDTSKATILKH